MDKMMQLRAKKKRTLQLCLVGTQSARSVQRGSAGVKWIVRFLLLPIPPGNCAVQDAVQTFLLSKEARAAGKILAAAGAAIFSLGFTIRPLKIPDAMRQARSRAFMQLLPMDPPD